MLGETDTGRTLGEVFNRLLSEPITTESALGGVLPPPSSGPAIHPSRKMRLDRVGGFWRDAKC